jgi:hypothetical protein
MSPDARLLAVAAGGGVAVLVAIGVLLIWLLDQDRPVRDLALRDARAAAQMDDARVWRDSSACFQRRHPEAEFIAEQGQADGVPRYPAPADTSYSVVAVRSDGLYRRVEVRVEATGHPQLDYEIDARMYGGQWVVVDRGAVGHPIADDCQPGGAR